MRAFHSVSSSLLLLGGLIATAAAALTDDVAAPSSKKTVTIMVTNYHTVCPCTVAALSTAIDVLPTLPTSSPEYTASTVYTTQVQTITACPPSVHDCPASQQTTYVTTKTVVDSITMCPVSLTTGQPTSETAPTATEGYTTSTVYTTKVNTVTACPSSVRSCPASEQTTYTTTETIIDYTTVCPITTTDTASYTLSTPLPGSASDTTSATGSLPAPGSSSGSGSVPTSTSVSKSTSGSGSGSEPTSSSGSTSEPESGSTSTSASASSPGSGSSSTTSHGGALPTAPGSSSSTAAISTPAISPSGTPSPTATPTPTPTPSPSSSSEPLAMYVVPVQGLRKRQTYNTPALIGSGAVSASCADADSFYVHAGHLFGAGLPVAAEKNVANATIIGSSRPGAIRGTFSVRDNVLSWANPAFEENEAQFCVAGRKVIAVFDGKLPSGCTEVLIMAVKYSEICGGGGPSTSFQPIPSPTSTPTGIPTCSAGSDPQLEKTVLPVQDPNLHRSSILNLVPSKYATLYYAEQSGSTVLEVGYYMTYPQVTLENSDLIETVACAGRSLTLTLKTKAAFNVVTQWPKSELILVTNSNTCNRSSQRGVYVVQGYLSKEDSLTVTFSVVATKWADVSDTMEVSYSVGTTNTTTPASQTTSCSEPFPSPTSTDGSVSYADLTPEQKDAVAFLTQNTTYNDDGSIGKTLTPVTANDTVVSLNPGSSNSTEQAALEDALQSAGLPSADDMWKKTASDLAGHCANGAWVPPTTVYTKRALSHSPATGQSMIARSPKPRGILLRRDGDVDDKSWWDYLWDFGCNDIVGAIIGAFSDDAGNMIELICKLKELYDTVEEAYENRDAIKCVLSECYIEEVIATYWDYTYAWKVEASIPAQDLVTSSRGTISCVDCSLTVSEIQFVGRVRITTKTGAVESAYMTPTMSWTGNLVMALKASSAWSGQWQYAFEPLEFETPVNVPGEFTITPSITYSLGVQWSTTDEVDFTGGAKVSVDKGSLYLDFMENSATQAANWSPQVEYTYPVFTSAATVSFIPIMRSSVSIAVEIRDSGYGKQPIYLNSATAIGFDAALMLEDGGDCPAGQLMMTSYSDVTSNVQYTGSDPIVLSDSGDVAGETKCFAVPNNVPTVNEVNSLRSVGGEFCTAYLDYSPPTSVKYAVTTATGPSTIHTTLPRTIYYTSTAYEFPTATTVFVQTTTVDPTVYVTATGSQSLGDAQMKKRAIQTAAPSPRVTSSPTLGLAGRAINEPAMVSDWEDDKISMACSQIATGTLTTTFYTSTATTYSGVVTSTVYSTVNALGDMVTQTFERVVVSYTATTVTADAPTATATTATTCPLQTQVSCFTITGHGPEHIDGKQLHLSPETDSLVWGGWGAGYEPGIFYLTCAGELVSLPSMKSLSAPSGMWVEFGEDASDGSNVKCTKDTGASTLSCGAGWYAIPPVAVSVNDYRAFSGYWQPVWSAGSNEYGLEGVALSYEGVECPCGY
ncbi:hypothetical protein BJY04DRAFT_223042 [Aspergillus karnatakaensis]|uniref:uncharacterized protein n=1 Tax=Aspergillus karnatakaensis TaxID=1810916 RepID=UPI003CCCBCDD